MLVTYVSISKEIESLRKSFGFFFRSSEQKPVEHPKQQIFGDPLDGVVCKSDQGLLQGLDTFIQMQTRKIPCWYCSVCFCNDCLLK